MWEKGLRRRETQHGARKKFVLRAFLGILIFCNFVIIGLCEIRGKIIDETIYGTIYGYL